MRNPVLTNGDPIETHPRGGGDHLDRLVEDLARGAICWAPEWGEVKAYAHRSRGIVYSRQPRSGSNIAVKLCRAAARWVRAVVSASPGVCASMARTISACSRSTAATRSGLDSARGE